MAHDALAMVTYGNEPVALLLGDSAAALERARAAAAAAGCRVAAAADVDAGPAWIEAQVRADVVMVELDGCPDSLDPLLEHLQQAAADGKLRSVVSSTIAAVDRAAAIAVDSGIEQLCDATLEDRTLALKAATEQRTLLVHDQRDNPGLLHQLSEEVSRIANILAALSEGSDRPAAPQDEESSETGADKVLDASFVRSIIRARRMRDQFFPAPIFADPAWDMLLDLMAARLDKERVAVSSLCIAAAVPATTALRWIRTMTDHGFFVRTADPEDRRRVYIGLSDEAARAMAAYLRALRRTGTIAP